MLKNILPIESSYISQPPKYLIITVNMFRCINSNITKNMCPILLDMTIVLGLHTLSLQATIDHRSSSMYSGYYTTFINYCKTPYCHDSKITEFERIDKTNSSSIYVVIYKLIT